MPEGPEVRRNADTLHDALAGQTIAALTARTKLAKAWLKDHPDAFVGRRVVSVRSRGKNLVGVVEGGLYFYVHLLMWGSWRVLHHVSPDEIDRRERARITTDTGVSAILFSAPVFEIGETAGDDDPLATHPYLATLGPDILPYPSQGAFASDCFVERLTLPENWGRQVGAVLLDQTVAAGVGNYLRAEILFACGISPFRRVADLTEGEIADLCRFVPEIARRAYETGGVTVPASVRVRMQEGRDRYVYPNGSTEWGARHWAFRRTNLPCLVCHTPIKQKRQVTRQTEAGEDKERIIYFCPRCQPAPAEVTDAG